MAKAYWWACDNPQCQKHQAQLSLEDVVHVGVVGFLRDQLSPVWDQSLLVSPCKSCEKGSLRITYDFPRADPEHIRVVHIVGLRHEDGPFLQMMWEGIADSDPGRPWIDFKYLYDANWRGLKGPCVFSQDELRRVFELYCDNTHKSQFP